LNQKRQNSFTTASAFSNILNYSTIGHASPTQWNKIKLPLLAGSGNFQLSCLEHKQWHVVSKQKRQNSSILASPFSISFKWSMISDANVTKLPHANSGNYLERKQRCMVLDQL
jgi:hypothetical protein